MEFVNLLNTLEEYSREFQKVYKSKLKRSDRLATGNLINSVKGEVVVGDRLITFELELEDYWKYVENGTRPHFPPPDAIKKWIMAKPIIPREVSGITPTTDQLAFLIGRKISRDGTKGTLDLTETIEELNSIWTKKIEDALEKDIEEYLEEIIITE